MGKPTRPIGAARERWIEVEPGAPLPPDVPPWAQRHDLVPMTNLSTTMRRVSLAVGGASAVASVVALALGDPRGYAGILPAAVFLYAGITGGGRFEGVVPDPNGRYVLAEPAPQPDPPAPDEGRPARKPAYWLNVLIAAVLVVGAGVLFADGSFAELSALLAALGVGALPSLIDRWKLGRDSEAIASEQFRRLSDPRQSLADAPTGPSTVEQLPAGALYASGDGSAASEPAKRGG